MKAIPLMSQAERKDTLELSLSNAQFMFRLERDIANGEGWCRERRQAAREAMPVWDQRIVKWKILLQHL